MLRGVRSAARDSRGTGPPWSRIVPPVSRRVAAFAEGAAGAVSTAIFFGAIALAPSCSSAPQAPPGGEAASRAAYAAGESYAKSLKRPLDRGRSDRAQADLGAVGRALEQHGADHSSYPDASACVDLAAALAAYRTPVPEEDPWGGAYECLSRPGGYSLRSAGEDGRMGTGDDIVVEGGQR